MKATVYEIQLFVSQYQRTLHLKPLEACSGGVACGGHIALTAEEAAIAHSNFGGMMLLEAYRSGFRTEPQPPWEGSLLGEISQELRAKTPPRPRSLSDEELFVHFSPLLVSLIQRFQEVGRQTAKTLRERNARLKQDLGL